jgi:hypothetical protein
MMDGLACRSRLVDLSTSALRRRRVRNAATLVVIGENRAALVRRRLLRPGDLTPSQLPESATPRFHSRGIGACSVAAESDDEE